MVALCRCGYVDAGSIIFRVPNFNSLEPSRVVVEKPIALSPSLWVDVEVVLSCNA